MSQNNIEGLNKQARKIIEDNIYLSLATTDGSIPWISPLYYVFDGKYNFYFISDKNSQHALNIAKNPNVAFSIFDSREIPDNVNGLQTKATCETVNITELPHAIKTIFSRKWSEIFKSRFKDVLDPQTYLKLTNFRVFKITPSAFYMLDPQVTETDKRVEIKLL